MTKGTIKWFNPVKGFGFIAPEGGAKDVFLHISAIESAGLGHLQEGQQVEFDLVRDNRGRSAAGNLRLID
jgi:CspA family cold shock protein